MLRHFVLKQSALNRIAIMAILPLMLLSMLWGTTGSEATRDLNESPREGTLAVANLRDSTLTIHDLGGDGETRTLLLQSPAHELAVAGGRIYATLPRANTLAEIDPFAPGVLRTVEAGAMVHGLALDANGDLVATLDGSRLLLTIDRETLQITGSAATGDTPHTVAVLDGIAYVTDSRDGNVRRLDLNMTDSTTPSALSAPYSALSAAAGRLPEAITTAGGRVVVADHDGGDLRWYTAALEPLGVLHLGGGPVRVLPLDGDRVAVALNLDARIAIVNLATGEVERRVRVAGHPDGLCLSPSGDFIGVASNEAGAVNIFRVADWKLMVTLGAGDGPGSCAWF